MLTFPSNKQCIMNRPIRPGIYSNFEHIEKEYQEQLLDLKVRQNKYNQHVEAIKQHVSPYKGEQASTAVSFLEATGRDLSSGTAERISSENLGCHPFDRAATRASMEEQLQMKEKMKEAEKLEEHKLFCYNEYLRRFHGPHCVEGHLARERERRAYLRELMKDNIEMAKLRKELERRDRQRQLEMDEIRAHTPCTWNRRHYI